MADSDPRAVRIMQILSAVFLIVTGAIHLFLVIDGVGGILGVAFTLNAIAGVVLGVAMLFLRGPLLALASVLSLLFLIATLLALVLALTVGLFGITETWDGTLVPQTVVIESLGIVVLAITTAVVLRGGAAASRAG